MSKPVYITRLAKFLPNAPVANDDMESYLGMVDGKPSLAKRIVLRNNGIKSRYYALDKEGNVTHTSVQMAAKAVEALCDERFTVDDIELMAAGTASPELVMPSHGVMVHGELGGKNIEVVSFAGSCCTGLQAMKYGYLSIADGQTENAVCVASERFSAWMQAKYFEGEIEAAHKLEADPMLAFEKEFLRWMLSDGAGALLLQNKPSEDGLSFKIEWIELCSYANERPTCMYAGADKDTETGDVKGWAMYPEAEWLSRSLFSLKQDTRLLGENIVQLGGKYLAQIAEKRGLKAEEVDWFLPHLSSMFFKQKIFDVLGEIGFNIPEEKWFLNLPSVGNVASCSTFLMLEEIYRAGKLKRGQKLLLMVPESARFSYGYSLLTVC